MTETAAPPQDIAILNPRNLTLAQARRELMWRDHGILRHAFNNYHWIGPGMARANQPSPEQLDRYAAMGFATIVNLRGVSDRGHYLLEQAACDRLGLRLVNMPISATTPPTVELVRAAQDLFATVRTPCLIHCKSGSDRTGLMGVLYRHLSQCDEIRVALDQLSPRFLHLRRGKAGMVDFFFETYLRRAHRRPIEFMDWMTTEYDPAVLAETYRRLPWIQGLGEWILDGLAGQEVVNRIDFALND